MTPKENFPCCKEPEHFCKLQRALFSSRRKNVRNNLTGFIKNNDKALEYLKKAQIDPTLRAEVLSIEQILHLSDIIISS